MNPDNSNPLDINCTSHITQSADQTKLERLRRSNQVSNSLTRESIQTALLYLMTQKPFHQITITELVRRAGVSRTAFYRNYAVKEDILEEISNHFILTLSESLISKEYQDNDYAWYLHVFQSSKERADIFRLLIQANIPKNSLSKVESILETIRPSSSVTEHYRTLALEGAFINILINWILHGTKESAEYMAAFCAQTLIFPKKEGLPPDTL